MRNLVIGDIHGGYKALMQCLERSKFDYEKDTLVQIGDIVDGWSEVFEVVEELNKIENVIAIRGNHDQWFVDWLNTNKHPQLWSQGGYGTLSSYCKKLDKNLQELSDGYITNLLPSDIPDSHIKFFKRQSFYCILNNNLFVHGGFNRHYDIDDLTFNNANVLIWDRDLWKSALGFKSMMRGVKENFQFRNVNKFKEIFIGHSSTTMWGENVPMNAANIWNLDTGGGWGGYLTIMDVDTKEYWQSDNVKELYKNEKGRN